MRAWLLSVLLCVAWAEAVFGHDLVCTAALSSDSSPATGSVTVTLDLDLFKMRVEVSFNNLQGSATTSHVHAATPSPFSGSAGIATQTPSFEMFPAGVTNGTYDHTFNLDEASTYNPDFITANGGTISTASNAFFAALVEGKAYLDIHSSAFADGEIRGFLVGPVVKVTDLSATASAGQRAIAIKGTVEPFGAGVLLENSADLGSWEGLGTGNSDPSNGEYILNTTEAASTSRQFYRVVDLLEPAERAPFRASSK